MTKEEAAHWIREGFKLARAYPERWMRGYIYVAWLMPDGKMKAFYEALGLAALAKAGGKMSYGDVSRLAVGRSDDDDGLEGALGYDLHMKISLASEKSKSVEDMIKNVEAVLKEHGL